MAKKIKKTLITTIALASFLLPSTCMPVKQKIKPINYEYLDQNKKVIERVEYYTFSENLNSGISKQKIENQDQFIEDIIEVINTHPSLTEERGHNVRRGVSTEEFGKFIFDDVLKEKLNYEIKTTTDLIVGLNMALEHLAKYNNKMPLEHYGLGSDINDDGRFDGINWSYLTKNDEQLQKEIKKKPEKGIKLAKKESKKIDGTPTDLLLMRRSSKHLYPELSWIGMEETKPIKQNSVELVCRNYTSALEIMFETAKKHYPELTKDVELLQMQEPGHIYVAFINKKTLEYIAMDPTTHDSSYDSELDANKEFYIRTMVIPKEDNSYYDCLQEEVAFQAFSLEKDLYYYLDEFNKPANKGMIPWDSFYYVYDKERILHGESKQMLEKMLSKVKELAKKYPNSSEIATLESMVYLEFLNHKEYSKAFELFKKLYDDKNRREKIEPNYLCLIHLALGELAFELKDYGQALKYYKECSKFRIALNYFVDEAMLGIAKSNMELGNYHEALFRAKDVLELCPEHYKRIRKEAKKVVSQSSNHIWGYDIWDYKTKNKGLYDYITGDYEKALQNLKENDAESRLLIAKSHDALNHYEQAKSLYEILMKEEKIAKLAKTELSQMNHKFFLYGYVHFFDEKIKQSVEEFEYLKNQITSEEEVAERLSYLLMYAYGVENNLKKAKEEANYFLKTFPNSEYKTHVQAYLHQLRYV